MPDDPLNPFIHPTFIQRFNRAVNLVNEGNAEAALKQYQHVFDPLEESQTQNAFKGFVTGKFLATVELRKAYCLMDLGRYTEARAIFEQLDEGFASQLDSEGLYSFYFSYGNTLGNLGFIEEMDRRLSRAMDLAAETLKDTEKCESVWYWRLHWGKQHKAWQYLEAQCVAANMFGVANNNMHMQILALEFRCYVHREWNRIEQARQGATGILQWKKLAQANPDIIREWEAFLESL